MAEGTAHLMRKNAWLVGAALVKRPSLPLLLLALAAAPLARAQQTVNPIHPVFAPLDAAGHKVRVAVEVSPDVTCGACHDAPWINAHTGHPDTKVKATCIQCHVNGGQLDVRPGTLDAEGRLTRQAIRIGTPGAANCAGCHGVVSDGSSPVVLPEAFEAAEKAPDRTCTITQGEGAVVAPQRMADTSLNLEGKASLDSPWDVHAAKLVDCVACHYAANAPGRIDGTDASLVHRTADPRRPRTAEFLYRPDHRLAEPSCRNCHDALQAHQFLPYRERHMAVVSCQACHLATPMGPALEMVDATVVTAAGTPAIRYRNMERRSGEPLNAAAIRPFRPLLVERLERDGVRRLAPVNPVSRFRWVSKADRAEVPWRLVSQVFLEGHGYAPAILEAFDANGDGRLDERELRLDSRLKTELVSYRLAAAGVVQPTIEGVLDSVPLAHGVPTRDRALRDCQACHAGDSRISEPFLISGYLPGGTSPSPREGARVEVAGLLETGSDGALVLWRDREVAPGGLHVLGHSRQELTNTVGIWLLAATFLGVLAHGLARWMLRGRRPPQPEHAPVAQGNLFGRYQRIWCWTMGLAGVALIGSGLEIHNSGGHWLLGLPRAVSLHNAFAVILVLNAALALIHHLTTRATRNFILFIGEPRPADAPGHELNPLQQLTYLGLLYVVLPFQIGSGLLIWAVGHWPAVATALGGLSVIAPLHNAGSWTFLSFFVLHVYLVTTGRSATHHLTPMVTAHGTLAPEEPETEWS